MTWTSLHVSGPLWKVLKCTFTTENTASGVWQNFIANLSCYMFIRRSSIKTGHERGSWLKRKREVQIQILQMWWNQDNYVAKRECLLPKRSKAMPINNSAFFSLTPFTKCPVKFQPSEMAVNLFHSSSKINDVSVYFSVWFLAKFQYGGTESLRVNSHNSAFLSSTAKIQVTKNTLCKCVFP